MYFREFLKQYENKKIKLFVDMDGVIADYIVGDAADYDKKRPLITSIEKLEEISKMDNVEMFILSVTRMDEGFDQKNYWLDKYAPFFKKENRYILSRESNNFKASSALKSDFIKSIEKENSSIIVIDDDPRVLKALQEISDDIILLKDTALVD